MKCREILRGSRLTWRKAGGMETSDDNGFGRPCPDGGAAGRALGGPLDRPAGTRPALALRGAVLASSARSFDHVAPATDRVRPRAPAGGLRDGPRGRSKGARARLD